MARLRYGLRALFLLAALGSDALVLGVVLGGDGVERTPARVTNLAISIAGLGAVLLFLFLREVVRVVRPPESSAGITLLVGRDDGLGGLGWTLLRGAIGTPLLVLAIVAGCETSWMVGVVCAVVGWLFGFAETRVTYFAAHRGLFVEGWLVPRWIPVAALEAVSVHVTFVTGVRTGRRYRPIALVRGGGTVEVGEDHGTDGERAAIAAAEHVAVSIGVPYFANPAIARGAIGMPALLR